MSRRQVLWCIPLLLALHNVEEAVTFPRYLPRVVAESPVWLLSFLGSITPADMYLALIVVTLIPVGIVLWADYRPSSVAAIRAALVVQAVVLLNVASHVAIAALVFHGYSPGVVTAVALNLPFSAYLFHRAAKERWLAHPS